MALLDLCLGIDVGEHFAVAASAQRAKAVSNNVDVVIVRSEPRVRHSQRVVATSEADLLIEVIEQGSEVRRLERKSRLPLKSIRLLVLRSETPPGRVVRSLGHRFELPVYLLNSAAIG